MNSTYHLNSNSRYWQVAWRDSSGRRRRRSLGSKLKITKRQAEAMVQQLVAEHAIVPALKDTNGNSTMSDWLERYLDLRKVEVDPKTLSIHKRTARLLLDFFGGDRKIGSVTKSQASDWRRFLLEQMGESTACKHVRVAKVIFNLAVDEGVLPQSAFTRLKGTAPVAAVWDRSLVERAVFDAVLAEAGEAEPLLMIGYHAGLRTQEILHLKWDHIEWMRNLLVVVPRGGKVTSKQRLREVRIEPDLMRWLLARHEVAKTDTVAGILEAGRKNLAARLVKQACERAGVTPFTCQRMRQTRDTLWHAEFPSHVACAWLGHSESVARRHYLTIPDSCYSEGHTPAPESGEGDATLRFEWAIKDSNEFIRARDSGVAPCE